MTRHPAGAVSPGPRLPATLGFACRWEPDPSSTWAGTPWGLRGALAARANVVDVGIRLAPAARGALKLAHVRWRDRRLVSAWNYSRSLDAVTHLAVHRKVRAHAPAAVVQIHDIAVPPAPFVIYQDLSWDLVAEELRHLDGCFQQFATVDDATIAHRRARQHRIYARAEGVLAMSHWFAASLVKHTGLAADRVHVVHPGCNATVADGVDAGGSAPPRTGRRLLFVGRDFFRKGGDLVVDAVNRLQAAGDRQLRLTIAGPPSWPLRGSIPDGVDFLGPVSSAHVATLLGQHDLFVMPSRFEAFGIAFVEALAAGLPCVARDDFAMPEIVREGVNGALVADGDAEEVAEAIARTLGDWDLRRRVQAERARVARYYSWTRAADDVLRVVGDRLAQYRSPNA